ncbi:MAG: matrixin family metalloprotease [Fimbriimonadales bacterium]
MQKKVITRVVAAALALPLAVGAAAADQFECRTIGSMSIVFFPGTTERQIQQTLERVAPFAFDDLDFQIGGRWSSTSFGGTGGTGNPMMLSYSYVPDGTNVPNAGLGSGGSTLFARMNALFGGNTALWQSKIAQVFTRWDDICGANYVLNNDDGAALHNSPGVQNVRGDVRISMITLTDPNVLAYNFFPNTGDMVMNHSFNWNQSSQDYRFIRNTIGHEHGHGMGIEHVIPVNNTKLMEPFLSTAFDGPQSDDIQAAQWLYGDRFENNDNNGQKTDLGIIANGQLVDLLAIERNTDTDWFKVMIPAGSNLNITVTPVGSTYSQGPQGGSATTRNSLIIHDLRMTVYQSDGTTLIQQQNAVGVGLPETINNIVRPANGEITLKIDSVTASGDIQRYRINFGLVAGSVQVQTNFYNLIRGVTVGGDLASLQASDDNRLILRPGIVFSSGQAPIEYEVRGTSTELTPTHLSMRIEASATAATVSRKVELFNFVTNLFEEVANAAMATTEGVVMIDISTNPERFVSGSGTISARISNRLTGPAFVYPWSTSTDHIYWQLVP